MKKQEMSRSREQRKEAFQSLLSKHQRQSSINQIDFSKNVLQKHQFRSQSRKVVEPRSNHKVLRERDLVQIPVCRSKSKEIIEEIENNIANVERTLDLINIQELQQKFSRMCLRSLSQKKLRMRIE